MHRPYSKTYRIFHWAIAIAFLLLSVTIFLRLTWMNRDHMAGIMGDFLSQAGVSLPQDQLVSMAKKVRSPMWQWHMYIGYVLVGLFTLRMLPPFAKEMRLQSPLTKGLSSSDQFRLWTYLIFYVCVAISLITGLYIELGPSDFHGEVEDIHKLSLYYLVPFIVIHLAGVLLAEFTNQKGIISRVISGDRDK